MKLSVMDQISEKDLTLKSAQPFCNRPDPKRVSADLCQQYDIQIA